MHSVVTHPELKDHCNTSSVCLTLLLGSRVLEFLSLCYARQHACRIIPDFLQLFVRRQYIVSPGIMSSFDFYHYGVCAQS